MSRSRKQKERILRQKLNHPNRTIQDNDNEQVEEIEEIDEDDKEVPEVTAEELEDIFLKADSNPQRSNR